MYVFVCPCAIVCVRGGLWVAYFISYLVVYNAILYIIICRTYVGCLFVVLYPRPSFVLIRLSHFQPNSKLHN